MKKNNNVKALCDFVRYICMNHRRKYLQIVVKEIVHDPVFRAQKSIPDGLHGLFSTKWTTAMVC